PGEVPDNNLFVPARGTVAQVEALFATRLGTYTVRGRGLRAPVSAPTIPAALAGVVSAAGGLHQGGLVRPRAVRVGGIASGRLAGGRSAARIAPGAVIPPPPGARDAPPCGQWYGQLADVTDPPYG